MTDRSSHYGPGFESRDAAIRDTRPLIQQLAASVPDFRPLALAWIRGTAKDDTLFCGPFIYGLYQYDGTSSDMQDQAGLWMVDLAGRGDFGLT